MATIPRALISTGSSGICMAPNTRLPQAARARPDGKRSQINTVKDMKEQILKIAEQLKYDEITTDYAQSLLLGLFGVSGSWVYVNEKTPPNDIELLAKSPDGTIHLTSWRPAYNIFSCQSKKESTFNWQWKMV